MRTSLCVVTLLTISLVLFSGPNYCASREVSGNRTDQSALATYIDLTKINSQFRFFQMAARKVRELWSYYTGKKDAGDGFIGRCLGIARKIKMAMPIIMVKLGVIVTVLGFLTLFSLKTLGLVGALLLMNIGGAVSKLTLFFASKKDDHHEENRKPQTVHFHIHGGKKGGAYPYGGYHDYEGWDRKESLVDRELEKLELYNLYDKLRRNPLYSRRSYSKR